MAEIGLRVTQKELDHVARVGKSQRQVGISSVSDDIAPRIRGRQKGQPRELLRLGGCIELVLGDTSAIWASHNSTRLREFDALYGFLSKFPDREVRFPCEMVSAIDPAQPRLPGV